MTVASMTGFAESTGSHEGLRWRWEAKSVNSRSLDMRLRIPPGYDGPLPEGGFYIGRSRTTRVLYAARAYLKDNSDPKPAVEQIKRTMKIYPYTPGGLGTSIATALEGKVRLRVSAISFMRIPPK